MKRFVNRFMVVCPVSELVDKGLDVDQKLTDEQREWLEKHTFYILDITGTQGPCIGSVVAEWEGSYKEHPDFGEDDILYVGRCLTDDLNRLFGLSSDIETYSIIRSEELDSEDREVEG